ncbi:hypothetical protein DFH08DRAFT_831415 [Mycena albidolilacea]|uniref:Uncharacterized protein n=1 Tax=Mycena albidolilacea TaxID=1033008 RepID=A0AAD7AUT6_9AGAR|nr:hypothetical protein DFH08DRAFT_831415 [Mycena albidolilacea]
MSIFPRADSPPPRSPSPDVVLAPLPPPVRRRISNRPARLSLQSSDERPKMERSQRSLASMRSCGDLRHPTTPKSASRFIVSAPPTPAPSSPSGSSFRRTHKRTLPFASPYRSPPASPLLSSPPPPVPPIPEFVLSPTDKKPVIHTAPVRVNHIYLPEWEQFTVTPDLASPLPRKKRVSMSPSGRRAVVAPAPAAMTCSTFFALHNQSQRPNQVVSL